MKKFSEFIANHPKLVLLVMTLLLIPSIIGYKATNINYDILSYLPTDLKSTQGQSILDKDFKNAATGMLILEGSDNDAEKLREQVQKSTGLRMLFPRLRFWVQLFLMNFCQTILEMCSMQKIVR